MTDDDIQQIYAQGGEVPAPHPDQPTDLVLTDMVRLKALPPAERTESLEPYVERWLEHGETRLKVATYLAAAGLTLEDAEQLEHLVGTRVKEEYRQRARTEFIQMAGLIGAGGVALWLGRFPGWGLALIGIGVGILVKFSRAMRLLRRITAVGEDEIER